MFNWLFFVSCFKDFCPNNPQEGTFRIVMTNAACGKSPTVCALKINVILQVSGFQVGNRKKRNVDTFLFASCNLLAHVLI